LDTTDLLNRFTYHAPKDGQAERYQKIRDAGLYVANLLNAECPESREKSLAVTHLEDAVMWANAAIARHE
jgi:hypothetical protein